VITRFSLIILAFVANYEKPERMHGMSFLGSVQFPHALRIGPIPLSIFVLAGFLFMWTAFSGSVLPTYGGETQEKIPTFGKGSNEVRVYADYLCPSCGSIEPAIVTQLNFMGVN